MATLQKPTARQKLLAKQQDKKLELLMHMYHKFSYSKIYTLAVMLGAPKEDIK